LYRIRFVPLDALLLLMTLIWGVNFTLVKVAVRSIPELPFNALRLVVAAAAFLAVLVVREGRPRFSRGEWWRVLKLALVGHVIYQLCFLGAVARTSVASTSLIFAFTPITVALITAAAGHDRVTGTQWIGAVISLLGIGFVVGAGSREESTVAGDALAVAAMACWAIYTVASRSLLTRHSPLAVTGYSLAIGAALYVPLAWGGLTGMTWSAVPHSAWIAAVASGLFALFVSYLIWYTAVRAVGSTHTAIYSNVTPVVAMVVAAAWLDEPLTLMKVAGTAAVILGVAVTRVERAGEEPPSKG